MPALLFLLIPPVAWLAFEAGRSKSRRENPDVPVSVQGVYLGDTMLNSDWSSKSKRHYAVLNYRPGLGYRWSPVFVADPVAARSRVMAPTLQRDGWLFTYQGGEWVKVVGR